MAVACHTKSGSGNEVMTATTFILLPLLVMLWGRKAGLQIGTCNRIQVLLISINAVELLHREAFAAPADEEPEATGEYEELEEAVEDGNLGSVLVFPAWIQVISTLPYPPAV